MEKEPLFNSLIAFIAFSLTTSAVYILNDYQDIEEDKNHPKKKNRPLASGTVSKSQAILIMSILLVMAVTIMAMLSSPATGILMFYVIMNFAYSFFLKNVAIVDITIIAIGFILRLFVGSVVTGIELSGWIIIMTFLLSIFIALAKRRDDLLIYLNTEKKMRQVIDGYNIKFLDTSMAIMAAVVIVAYTNYTLSSEVLLRVHDENLYLTSFFVVLGIMRYLQLTFVFESSGSPTRVLLKDRFIQMTLIGWIATFFYMLYC